MAGGSWTSQNKVRPGVYINFESQSKPVGALGQRGITSLALSLPWGESKKIIPIHVGENVQSVLNIGQADESLLLLNEALKRARTVLVYRLNNGTAASGALGDLTVTARYGGTLGNRLSVAVQENIDNDSLFDVITYLDGIETDNQTVASLASLVDNDYVLFSGTGTLEETAGVPLTGGADGAVTNQDHVDYLAALELQDFHTFAYTGNDAPLKALYVAFVKRIRGEGKKVQLAVENYPVADYEGTISVKNGVVLSDGTTLTAAQVCAWVAAATAGAAVNQALTYSTYDDAVDALPRLTNSETIVALKAGEFVFTATNGAVVVEQDINSLTSFTPDKGKLFSKNRVIRVLDSVANDVKHLFEQFYIGKVSNNADGRALLKAEVVSYVMTLQGLGAIQNFDSQMDVTVQAGNETETVVIDLSIQPVDAVEKIYIRVEVK